MSTQTTELRNEQNDDLGVLHVVTVVLAVLCTIFDAFIIGGYLWGYLEGMSRVAIIGILGANLVAIVCAFLTGRTKNPNVFWTALVCELLITGLLLFNASNVFDQIKGERQEDRQAKREIERLKAANDAKKELLAEEARLAKELAGADRTLGRQFLKTHASAAPSPSPSPSATPEAEAETKSATLSSVERKLLTSGPLYLALIVVGALLIAARAQPKKAKTQSGGNSPNQ